MRKPLDNFIVTQPFGARPEYYARYGMKGHNGLDLRTRFWDTPLGRRYVYAVENGTIADVQWSKTGYGYHIRHGGEHGQFVYAHLAKIYVAKYQIVKEGQIIGITDSTGDVSGPHLHFGWRPFGSPSFNYENGYLGYEDPMKLWKPTPPPQPQGKVTVPIARIGIQMPLGQAFQTEVDRFTKNRITLDISDYSVPVSPVGEMVTQEQAYGIIDTVNPKESFVFIHYGSAPFAATYSYPAKRKYISTIPANITAKNLAFELGHQLQFFCNDRFNAKIQVEDSNFPSDDFIAKKYVTVLPYLANIAKEVMML